ncbi:MAG: hypothetical protein FJY10_09310 [Bacteroidetes bacterium]|nr:hypothetical protein [Bacteroidota bacterium]
MKWYVLLGMWGMFSLLMVCLLRGQPISPKNHLRLGTTFNPDKGWVDNINPEFIMSDTVIEACCGLFTDPGGKKFNYPPNQDVTMTIMPAPGHLIQVSFQRFDLEYQSGCHFDYLKVFNGANSNAPVLGTFCGQSLPGDFTGNNPDGALTFVFHSDLTIEKQGWEALISCIPITFPPIADFSSDHVIGMPGGVICFQDLSVPIPSSWNWTITPAIVTFVEGTGPYSRNPKVLFPFPGVYQVSLTVENGYGSGCMIKDDYIQIRNYLLYEDFEEAGSGPEGWSQEALTGSVSWLFMNGSPAMHPPLAFQGSGNATISGTGGQTLLISPWFEIDSFPTRLIFRHYQEAFAGWQDQLSIVYREDSTSPWIPIPGANWNGNTSTWVVHCVSIPCINSSCQLGFLGSVSGGYGVCLDEIEVMHEPAILDLRLMLQGLIDPSTGQMLPARDENGPIWNDSIADLIRISFHHTNPPHQSLAPVIDAMLNTSGQVLALLPGYLTASAYLSTQHRNSLETWSAVPIPLNPDTVRYDFSCAASQAFGSNQCAISSGVYALFSGDVNQDGVIDCNDLGIVEQEMQFFNFGYLPSDLNGDGIVDSNDMAIIEMNAANFLEVQKPS